MSMHTEAEAKQKVCHRSMGTPRTELCQGSICMAWRWASPDTWKLEAAPELVKVGYCGLAGKP